MSFGLETSVKAGSAEPWCAGWLTDEYRRLEILGDSGGQGWRAHEGSEGDR